MSPKRNGLRQQVTETKERPLELRGERDKENVAGKGMGKAQIHSLPRDIAVFSFYKTHIVL